MPLQRGLAMKRFFAAGIVTSIVAGSAGAADVSRNMPAKAEPAAAVTPPASISWTGCYVGPHIGGGWGGAHWSDPAGFPLANGSPLFGTSPFFLDQQISGIMAGGQVGCRVQFLPNWVAGIDGDLSGTKIRRTDDQTIFVTPPGVGIPTRLQTETTWMASATGNIGYAFDRLLLYGKGGAAWAHSRYEVAATPAVFPGSDFTANEIRSGWVVGAGIEYALTNHVSAKLEYDYYDFGSRNTAFLSPTSPAASSQNIAQRINAIKFGLNYNFWDLNAPASASGANALASAADFGSSTWHETFQSEARFFSWKSNRGVPTNQMTPGGNPQPITANGSGSETYIPYAMQLVGQPGDFKVEVLGRGGWVRASQSTVGITGQVSTATDTVASTTVTYTGLQGVQPFASLALNLPTGLAALPGTAANARMDPDLVDIASFGEGFNFGPTLGFNLPITDSFILSMSAGYTRRGAFSRESGLTPPGPGHGGEPIPSIINPGNVYTVTGSVGYQNGPFTGKLTGTISNETTTMVNNMPFVRPGKRYLVAGTGSYTWPWEHVGVTTLDASAAHSNSNDVLFVFFGAPTFLIPEPFNTNSNLYRVGLEHTFDFGKFVVGPTGSFLFRDNNGYDPTTVQFVPSKERWSAGMITRYAASDSVVLNARVERVWTRENESLAPGNERFSILAQTTLLAFTVPVVSSTGWQFVFGATANF